MKNNLYSYLLLLGDNPMILGHRLSELCGHGPSLETDIALTNISLDLFGQTRLYFQYAAEIADAETTEDKIAFLRYSHQYKNVLLVEQPNSDFAHVITRQFLFDAWHQPFLEKLAGSKDERIAAIAAKSLKEARYHLTFSSEWMKRLGDGTELSHQKMQSALDYLYPYAGELIMPVETETDMAAKGIGVDSEPIKKSYLSTIQDIVKTAGLTLPEVARSQSGGKTGVHSEHMGYILADLQYMQRAYPDMEW